MFSANKLVAGLVGAGSLGSIGVAGAYYGGLFSNDEKKETTTKTIVNISEQLEKEGFTVLNSISKQGDWDTVLNDYKGQNTKTFLSKIEDADHKAKCREILSLEKDIPDYANAKRWCVKKEKMKAVLQRVGFKALKSGTAIDPQEKSHWTEKILAIKELTAKPFPELHSTIKNEDEHMDSNINLLRNQCEKIDIEKLETTNEDFGSKFELMKEWCSIKSDN